MVRDGFRIEVAPTLTLAALSALSGAAMAGLLAWVLRDSVAYAEEPPQAYEVTALRSQVASLEAALYAAEGERCPNLGTEPKVMRRSR